MSKSHIKEENVAQSDAFHRVKGDDCKSIEHYVADFRRNINEFVRANARERSTSKLFWTKKEV